MLVLSGKSALINLLITRCYLDYDHNVAEVLQEISIFLISFQYDRTAVHIAAERGFSEIVEYLVDKAKVDINVRAKVGFSQYQNCHDAIIKSLYIYIYIYICVCVCACVCVCVYRFF